MKKINISDLFEQEDVFKGIRKSAIDTIETLQKVQAELKESAKVIQNDIKNSSTNSAKGLKEFSDAAKAASQVMKDSATIAKQQAQAEQQRIKVDQELIKLEKLKAQEIARANKEAEKAAKLAANEVSAYSKLSAELNKASKAYKDLAVTNQENTAEGKELLETVTRLDKQLKAVDATVGQHQRNVGNYEGATRNLKKELRALTVELMNMETSDPRFQEMTQRAGELKDQISDTQAVVKATAGSAMENFAGATVKVGQVGVAAFQGLQSSMMLLGVENEAVLESMAKLQALAGLGDALQTLGGLGDMLTGISAGFAAAASKTVAFVTGQTASTAATVADTTATVANTAARAASNVSNEVGIVTQEAQAVATVAATTATEAQGVATVATTVATTGATTAMKALRIALITSGIGAIVVVLGLAAEAMGLFSDKTEEEEKAQKLLEKQTKSLENAIESYNRATNAVIQTIDNATRSELALARQRGASQRELTQITKDGAKSRLAALQSENEGLKAQYLLYSKRGSTEQFEKAEKAYLESSQKVREAQINIQEIDADIAEQARDNAQSFAQTTTKTVQEIVNLYDQIIDEQIKQIKDEDQRSQTQLIVEAERRKKEIEKTVADKKQKAQLIKLVEENLIAELDKLDEAWYQKSLEAQKQADANKLKAKNDFLDELEKITEDNTRRTMSDQDVEERDVNDKYFRLQELAKGDAEALAQIEIAKMNELNDIRLKYQNIEYKNKEENDKKIKEAEEKKNEEMWQTTQEFAQKTTEFFKQQSDERIAQMDKEISAAEKQADYYRELAANGNISAKESLAEQERIIAESNRRKEREQKRQQRMELANTIYQTYAGHAAKDPETALMKTIKDASLLQAFISTLPMFYDGTEDTGRGGGVDGKGGFHAVLHPHERVIPKSLNDQIGNLTNEQLTRLAMEYQNGKLVGKDVAHSSLELAVLVNKLDNLTEVIKQKPETNIELGQITQSAMEIVQSTRKGNTTVYNRFKVRS